MQKNAKHVHAIWQGNKQINKKNQNNNNNKTRNVRKTEVVKSQK